MTGPFNIARLILLKQDIDECNASIARLRKLGLRFEENVVTALRMKLAHERFGILQFNGPAY